MNTLQTPHVRFAMFRQCQRRSVSYQFAWFGFHILVLEAAPFTSSLKNVRNTQVLSPPWSTQAEAAIFQSIFTHSDIAQLEKSVCMGMMLCSKAAYWESPVLASLSCFAAWESWKAASGWAESGSRVHSLSSRSATPFRSSQKPKAKAAFLRRFSSWQIQIQNSNLNFKKYNYL